MAGAVAERLVLREGDRDRLVGLTRATAGRAGPDPVAGRRRHAQR